MTDYWRVNKFRHYCSNLFVATDQWLNAALFGGDPDETISSVLGKKYYDSRMARILCAIISYVFRESKHCRKWIEHDEGKDAL